MCLHVWMFELKQRCVYMCVIKFYCFISFISLIGPTLIIFTAVILSGPNFHDFHNTSSCSRSYNSMSQRGSVTTDKTRKQNSKTFLLVYRLHSAWCHKPFFIRTSISWFQCTNLYILTFSDTVKAKQSLDFFVSTLGKFLTFAIHGRMC